MLREFTFFLYYLFKFCYTFCSCSTGQLTQQHPRWCVAHDRCIS